MVTRYPLPLPRLTLLTDLISALQLRPEVCGRSGTVYAFIARAQCQLIEHMTLQPDLSVERNSWRQSVPAQRSLVYQDFEIHSLEIEMHPIQVAAGERILEWLKSDNAT